MCLNKQYTHLMDLKSENDPFLYSDTSAAQAIDKGTFNVS